MSSSRDDLLAARAHGHESVNLEQLPTREHNGDLPQRNQYANLRQHLCLWTESDGKQCLQNLDYASARTHLAAAHRVKDIPSEAFVSCKVQGCGGKVRRMNFLRHFREVHMGYSRMSSHRTKRKHEAQSNFLEIGRKMSEPRVIWQRDSAEELEGIESHSDSAHTERSELEPVSSSQDEVEIEQEDSDRRIDSVYPESNDPLLDVSIPEPAFWEFGSNSLSPCTSIEPRKTGVISRFLTLFQSRKSHRRAQERIQTYGDVVYAARPTPRVFVASRDGNEGEGHTDQRGQGETLDRIDTVASATDSRDGQISGDGYHGSYCVCYCKPFRAPRFRRR